MLVIECRRVVGCHRGPYQAHSPSGGGDANLNPTAGNCDCEGYGYCSVAEWRRRRQVEPGRDQLRPRRLQRAGLVGKRLSRLAGESILSACNSSEQLYTTDNGTPGAARRRPAGARTGRRRRTRCLDTPGSIPRRCATLGGIGPARRLRPSLSPAVTVPHAARRAARAHGRGHGRSNRLRAAHGGPACAGSGAQPVRKPTGGSESRAAPA